MGILDDAIKEHLELKRQHGADQSELKQLEDEAFGAAERPGSEKSASDPLAEAPTQFMEQPEPVEAEEGSGRRQPRAEIADLQEAPEPETEPEPASQSEKPGEPQPSAGHSTEERHAIAEQPTEMFDVEEELAGTEAKAPSEEELVEQEMTGPRLAPVDPLSGLQEADEEDDGEEEAASDDADASLDEEFWDEKRLSDELDQALEAPIVETDEGGEPQAGSEPEAASEPQAPALEHENEDVLEETPDFLEEAPEDDQLWFEQKPPKDFDFDD
jgi:hypothetical protein